MQKGTAALFIVVIILLIVVLGSALFFGLSKIKIDPPSEEKILANLPLPAPKLNPSSSPQIYQNQKLGIKFEYFLKDYLVREDSEEDFNKRSAGAARNTSSGDYRKNFKGYVGYEPPGFLGGVVLLDKNNSYDISPLTVWIFGNPDNWTIDKWFGSFWYYPFVWGVFDWTSKGHITPDTEGTISGQLAKSKIVSYQPGKPKFVYVAKGQKMYLFRIVGEDGDKILTNFKFLD